MNRKLLTGYIVLVLSILLIVFFLVALKNMADSSEEANTFQVGVFIGACIGLAIQVSIVLLVSFGQKNNKKVKAAGAKG